MGSVFECLSVDIEGTVGVILLEREDKWLRITNTLHAQQHNSLCFIFYFGGVSRLHSLVAGPCVCTCALQRPLSLAVHPRLAQRLLKVRAGGCQQDARIRKVEAVEEACACAG